MSKHPHRYEVPLTEEEKAERRLAQLEEHPHSLLRALKAGGIGTTHFAGHFIAQIDECLCRDPLPVDPERPEITRPRIYPHSLYCMQHDVEQSVRQVTDRWRKMPKKEQQFLAKVYPAEPQGTDFYLVEAGEDYARRGLSTRLKTALAAAEAKPDEPLRACVVRCRDAALADEIAEEKRGELPWAEALKLRESGELPIGWHGEPLSITEQRALQEQQDEDRRAKRERRDRVVREMLREPL